jgi:hypothetical protein
MTTHKLNAKPKSEKSFVTQEEVHNMIKALPMFQKPTKLKKRKVILDSDSELEAVNNRNSELSDSKYTADYCYNIETTSAKCEKTSHLTTEVNSQNNRLPQREETHSVSVGHWHKCHDYTTRVRREGEGKRVQTTGSH